MNWLREVAKKILPRRAIVFYRRRRAVKRYIKALSYELLDRETRLDDLESRVAARRDGFYERLVRDVLERTDVILQELDRRLEGLRARHGGRLDALEAAVAELRTAAGRLEAATPGDGAESGTLPASNGGGGGATRAASETHA